MQDKLKELFENEEMLDTHEPNMGHRKRFIDRLDQEMDHKPEGLQLNISYKVMRIAAIGVVLVTAISFAWFWDQTKTSPNTIDQVMTLADVSEKYQQVETFYQEQMSSKLVKLQAEDAAMEQVTYKEALTKLETLELEYKRLESDLAKNPGNTRIVFAMIKNYQLRITVLETLLQKLNIEETQKHEENEKAYVSPLFPMGIHLVSLSA